MCLHVEVPIMILLNLNKMPQRSDYFCVGILDSSKFFKGNSFHSVPLLWKPTRVRNPAVLPGKHLAQGVARRHTSGQFGNVIFCHPFRTQKSSLNCVACCLPFFPRMHCSVSQFTAFPCPSWSVSCCRDWFEYSTAKSVLLWSVSRWRVIQCDLVLCWLL